MMVEVKGRSINGQIVAFAESNPMVVYRSPEYTSYKEESELTVRIFENVCEFDKYRSDGEKHTTLEALQFIGRFQICFCLPPKWPRICDINGEATIYVERDSIKDKPTFLIVRGWR